MMNDIIKGISILSLTTIAISWVLSQDNKGFDLNFLTNNNATTQQNSAVLQLQQSILAGADPTQSQEPSAAGGLGFNCYTGQVSLNPEKMGSEKTRGQQAYISVEDQTRMFLRVIGQNIILEIQATDKTTARKVESVPTDIAVALADMDIGEEQCVRNNLVLTLLK